MLTPRNSVADEKVECKPLGAPVNGTMSRDGAVVETVVVLNCNGGYIFLLPTFHGYLIYFRKPHGIHANPSTNFGQNLL